MGKQERWLYRRARRRVRNLINFYRHLIMYVILAIFFLIFNVVTGTDQWLMYSLVFLAWGLIIGFHALYVFALDTLFTAEWEDRKIKEYMDKRLNKFKKSAEES